jgi:hypothetical protein
VLWRQTIEKLASSPYQFSRHRIATTNDYAGEFRELIADFVRAESFAEVTGDTNRLAEIEMALRLPPDRAEFWRTNLLTILEGWTGCRGEPLSGGISGWQLKKHHDPNLFRLVRSKGWTLIGCGQNQLPRQDEYLQRIKQTGSPVEPPGAQGGVKGGSWLEVSLDLPNLPTLGPAFFSSEEGREGLTPGPASLTNSEPANLISQLGLKSIPAANLSLAGRESNLLLKCDFVFPDAFAWKCEPWQIPTNLVRDPIISFTAIQRCAPLLKHYQRALDLQVDQFPNQFFMWAGAAFPVQVLAAAPIKDAAGYLNNLAPQFMARFNPQLELHDAGGFVMTTNSFGGGKLRWMGIPVFVTPFVTVEKDLGQDFLFAGVFPNWGATNPPPVLFEYLASRTNLVFYDWEDTGPHAYAWRNIINIFRHFLEKPRLGPETASIVWINSISNRLGNTVTEVTRSDSNRLAFVRQGAVGLTGLELIALAHWLESTNFPLNGLALAARTNQVAGDK